MRWWFALLLVIFITACGSTASSTSAPTDPGLQPATVTPGLLEPADQTLVLLPVALPISAQLTQYNLQVNLDAANHSFQGHARLDYTNTETVPLESLYFRLYPNGGMIYGDGSLSVSGVLVDGQPAQGISSLSNSVLEVKLPAPLSVGAQTLVEMDFAGVLPLDFGSQEPPSGYGIYNYSEGVLAMANWYPILAVYDDEGWNLDPVYPLGDAVYSDLALYTVDLTVPSDLTVATSGVEIGQSKDNGTTRYLFVSGPARDFFVIASSDFKLTSDDVSGTRVNVYYLPGDAEGGQAALETVSRSLDIYIQLFGPYPYTEFDLVEAPMNNAGGVEYPGIVLIETERFSEPQGNVFITTVAHEVAHQWWYNVVGNDVIDEPWLDEALTTYSSILYWEQLQGPSASQQVLEYFQGSYDHAVQQGQDAPVNMSVPYFAQDETHAQAYGPIVYSKGALFLDAVRQAIGDQAFFHALQSYYADRWFATATASDLLGAFESASGQPLDALYQQWLYYPPVENTPTPASPPVSTPTPEPSPTPTPQPVIFAAIGDYGTGDENEAAVAELVLSWQPEFIISLGDNNYPFGAPQTIDDHIGQFYHSYIFPYLGEYGAGAEVNLFFPTIGNHDVRWDKGQPYLDYFTLPGNERYYDFTWGPLHFFALDNESNEPDGVGRSSIQAQWLQEQMAASTSLWNIVYMHYPAYSSGRHGPTDWAQWPYAEWGADAVLSGHDHTYERLTVDGIPYFVNGLGGGEIYDFEQLQPQSSMRYNAGFGAMRIEASEQKIIFQFVAVGGEIIDSFEIQH
jgi:hypothetical protein